MNLAIPIKKNSVSKLTASILAFPIVCSLWRHFLNQDTSEH